MKYLPKNHWRPAEEETQGRNQQILWCQSVESICFSVKKKGEKRIQFVNPADTLTQKFRKYLLFCQEVREETHPNVQINLKLFFANHN